MARIPLKAGLAYLRRILQHKLFVWRAGRMIGGIPLWRLVIHDWSKLTRAEFAPYCRRFHCHPKAGDQVIVRFGFRIPALPKVEGSIRLGARLVSMDGGGKATVRMLDEWREGELATLPQSDVEELESVRLDFSRAWLHHQNRNPHHWEHWQARNYDGSCEPVPMPPRFVREMVADWLAAARAYEGFWPVNAYPWLMANWPKLRDRLHPEARLLVESLVKKHVGIDLREEPT